MTEPVSTGPKTVEPSQPAAEVKPTPQPLTPDGALKWNRYIDRYVVCFVLLLVLIANLRPISQSSIWALVRSGDSILSGGPITTDSFSFSRQGERWVNIPWLFEVGNSALYRGVERAFDSREFPGRGAWLGASAMVVVNALLVTLAAAALLTIRHRGPGLWWQSVCVFLALGGVFVPSGQGWMPAVGGIANSKSIVEPDSWGLALLALELVVLFRGSQAGRDRTLWLLPVIFALWANVAANFAFGLTLLAVWAVGHTIAALLSRGKSAQPALPTWIPGAVFVVSALACLANPSTYQVFPTAFQPFIDIFPRWAGRSTRLLTNEFGFFDRLSRAYIDRSAGPGSANSFLLYYLIMVLAVVASFGLNWRRFSLPRFLMFVAAALLWAGLARLAPPFALVVAATLGLNGQEWYHDTFGSGGHVSRSWRFFSDFGRALTIIVVSAFIGLAVTGLQSPEGDTFGVGYDDSRLAFEMGDYLRDAGIEGNVITLTRALGDSVLWRAPNRKVYIDNRDGLYPAEQQDELEALRTALRKDDRAAWTAILDRYTQDDKPVTAVVVSPDYEAIYRALMKSADWIPIHDSGNAVVFGRADLAKDSPDLALFEKSRLDARRLAFESTTALPEPERPPSASTGMDKILQYRALRPIQPRVDSGGRWLTNPTEPGAAPEIARMLLAIRDARLALVKNPDDSVAYDLLSKAYAALAASEAEILTRDPNTNANGLPLAYSLFRYRQRVAALNFAVTTAAPPTTPAASNRLGTLHRELAGLFDNNRAFDLERKHLEAAREYLGSSFPEFLEQQLTRLNEEYTQFQDQLQDFTVSTSASPIQLANMASQGGYPGLAIQYFLDAENAGFSLAQLRFALVDLYCQTGQPDKAFDLLQGITANDESLGLDGSTPLLRLARAGYRNGLVNLLLGYYGMASRFLGVSTLPYIRQAEGEQTIGAARDLLQGRGINAVHAILEVAGTPEQPGLIDTYAEWEAELGLCLLESGVARDVLDARGSLVQEGAGTHFLRALSIKPRFALRPLLAYYLEQMGLEVPPLPEPEPEPEHAAAAEPTPASASPETLPDTEQPASENPAPAATEPAPAPAPADDKKPEPSTPTEPDEPSGEAKPASEKPAPAPADDKQPKPSTPTEPGEPSGEAK